MKKLLLIIGIFAVGGLVGWHLWYVHALSPLNADSDRRITVSIPSGSSSAAIADLLEEKDVIRSSTAFLMYAKKSGKAGSLQAGAFVLQPSMTVQEIVDALASGKAQEMSVTIPEGFTVKDIDVLLASKGFTQPLDIVTCAQTCDFSAFDFLPSGKGQAARGGKLEGYLYPDTYFVDISDFDSKLFLERMLGIFRGKVVNIDSPTRSLHEVITMASLIEEEGRTAEERKVISGILWKRFDEGIGLYVDASNRYILDKPTAAITASELDMDSPYNLRKYRGLPPGPIANPGLESINASVHPESSPYYYYLHGTDGTIHYAITNNEHNANKAKFLR